MNVVNAPSADGILEQIVEGHVLNMDVRDAVVGANEIQVAVLEVLKRD